MCVAAVVAGTVGANAQKYDNGLIDKSVAVVGEEMIKISAMEEEIKVMRANGMLSDKNVRCELLEQMIISKIFLNELAHEFGIDYSELLTHKKGDWIEYEGGTGLLHLAYIKAFEPSGKLAPLEYATPLIKDILLSIRKKELVSALEDKLMEDARAEGVFVQY